MLPPNDLFPQKDFTDIPDCYFEIFPKLPINELRVLLAVLRQNLGLNRWGSQISFPLLIKHTGMEKKAICECLSSLLHKGIIIKELNPDILPQEECIEKVK